MLTETHAPMPRWLYLASKPCHTITIAVALHALAGVPWLIAAWVAVIAYVGIGLALWYRHGVRQWVGPGSFTGDLLYHTVPSMPAPILLAALPLTLTWALCVACLLVWWQLDAANYGPMRSPSS